METVKTKKLATPAGFFVLKTRVTKRSPLSAVIFAWLFLIYETADVIAGRRRCSARFNWHCFFRDESVNQIGMDMKQRSMGPAIKLFCVAAVSALLFSCGKKGDKEIQQDVVAKLNDNNYKNLSVAVKDGVVTLDGTCEGDSCAAKAQHLAASVEDVQSVKNNVQANTKTDLTLRTSVQQIISKYQGVEADVANGVVVLRGTINRDQLQPLMAELQAINPTKIDNQLAIK